MTRAHQLRHGMTAIEVLCATVLAALLMTAVLGFVSGLTRHERALTRRTTPRWCERLGQQLAADLRLAHRIEVTPTSLRLDGPFERDPITGTANWRTGFVIYQFEDLNERKVLFRRVGLAGTLSTATQREVAAVDVSALALLLAGEELQELQAISLGSMVSSFPPGPLPPRLRLIVTDSSTILFDHTLCSPQ